jgi:hypothetical protein
LFKIHGVPRELLTDNGVEFGGTSKNSDIVKQQRELFNLFWKLAKK